MGVTFDNGQLWRGSTHHCGRRYKVGLGERDGGVATSERTRLGVKEKKRRTSGGLDQRNRASSTGFKRAAAGQATRTLDRDSLPNPKPKAGRRVSVRVDRRCENTAGPNDPRARNHPACRVLIAVYLTVRGYRGLRPMAMPPVCCFY